MLCNIMYIYFLLFQDTGGKDNCDCKIEDDIMKFFFNHSVCDVCVTSPHRSDSVPS